MGCEGLAAQAITILGLSTVLGFICSLAVTLFYSLLLVLASLVKKRPLSLGKVWTTYLIVTAVMFLWLFGLIWLGDTMGCSWWSA